MVLLNVLNIKICFSIDNFINIRYRYSQYRYFFNTSHSTINNVNYAVLKLFDVMHVLGT